MKDENIVNDVIKRIEKMLVYKNNISVSDVGKISGYSTRYIQKNSKKLLVLILAPILKKED
ncbi:hypothetical protein [Escherichia coli]|uniref:hypothetical protein n=1 Tax=Escherichia coli TaxID=562 RepID=UPI000246EAA2|nr:hypothetical protein [Escherichia coli]EHN94231.1 hypothetical protein ESOG_04691 [Escherichia coli E101]